MRLWRRNDGPDPDNCEHPWRVREVPSALQGQGAWQVCDLCGAMRLEGPEEIAGRASEQAAGLIEAPADLLHRIGSPSSVHLAHGDGWEQLPARAS